MKTYSRPPFFSIIVPVYNHQESVKKCLSSLLSQTYEEIEIIVVDDGSSDDSRKVIFEFEQKDDRIKVILKDQNESLLAARMSAMEQVEGRYVINVDSDDYLDIQACEILTRELTDQECDILEFKHIEEPQGVVPDWTDIPPKKYG